MVHKVLNIKNGKHYQSGSQASLLSVGRMFYPEVSDNVLNKK